MIAPPALVAYASELAGQPVVVRCWKDSSVEAVAPGGVMTAFTTYEQPTDEDGNDVGAPVFGRTLDDGSFDATPTITLKTSACKRIVVLLTPRAPAGSGPHMVRRKLTFTWYLENPDAYALHDVLHEALHIRMDSGDESAVECATEQNRWSAIAPLHRTVAKDDSLMSGMRERHFASPQSYLEDC